VNRSERPSSAYDAGMAPLEWLALRRLRQSLVGGLRGRVLEIGVGTGANLPCYDPSVQLFAVEWNPAHLRVAATRPRPPRAVLLRSDAECLPLAAHSVDHTVSTLALCSIPHPERALAEIRRVLRPGGTLVMLEHMQGEGRLACGLTRACAGLWYAVSRSCRIDRRTRESVLDAGFRLREERRYLSGTVRMMVAEAAR